MHAPARYRAVAVGATIALAATIVGYAAWAEPENSAVNPAGTTVRAPLNTGNIHQKRDGGIEVAAGSPPYGLIVHGTPATGRVGIGTANPSEKLDVKGSVNLTGSIRTYLDYESGGIDLGSTGELLSRSFYTDTLGNVHHSMDWTPDLAWLTIQSIDVTSGTCSRTFPACPPGWNEYETFTLHPTCKVSGTPYYGGAVRTCVQAIPTP
jgi:hypothetical protein